MRIFLFLLICACNNSSPDMCSYEYVSEFDKEVEKQTRANVTMTPFRIREIATRSEEYSQDRILARHLMHSVKRNIDGDVAYISPILAVSRIANLQQLLSGKSNLVSFLFDMRDCAQIPAHWTSVMGQMTSVHVPHVYILRQGMSAQARKILYESAFSLYRFTLILDKGDLAISEPLIHAIFFHTVPVYNGFFEMSTMFSNGVVAWNQRNFSMHQLESFIAIE